MVSVEVVLVAGMSRVVGGVNVTVTLFVSARSVSML